MNGESLLLVLAAIQGGLVILDFVDRLATRRSRYEGERLRPEGVVFLAAVLITFLAMQYGGLRLVPRAGELLADVRRGFAGLLGRPLEREPMGPLPLAVTAVFAFYGAGFWDYLLHRAFHSGRWLWFAHENHHLPNQVFLAMPGIAVRPFAVVAVFPVLLATILSTYAVLALFGWPLWDLEPLEAVLFVQVTVLGASHSSFLRRFRVVHEGMKRLALTSPQEHVLHHTVDLKGNYGNFTTLWDRLFGTYLNPLLAQHQGHRLGLPYDQDFLGTLTLGRWKLPERWRRRLQVARYCNLDPNG